MNVKPKIFLDTNLLIYAHTNIEVSKQHEIQSIIANERTVISTQVLKEAANVLHKKFKFGWTDIQKVLLDMSSNNEVYTNDFVSIQQACQISQRYQFSFYDSLIVASALSAECNALYSEDLQYGQVVEQVLTVKNPFL